MKVTTVVVAGLALVLLWLLAVFQLGPDIEGDLGARADAVLVESGMGWAHVSADGRQLRLSGVAPNAQILKQAEHLLGRLPGVAGVTQEATLARLAPVGSAPPSRGLAGDAQANCREEIDGLIEQSRIYFRDARYTLRATDRPQLDALAVAMSRCPSVRIEVAGHADERGPAWVNRRLSLDRASSVIDHLVAAGVSPDRLTVGTFGESQPIASNSTEAGRAKNRRIEFNLLGS